MTTRNLARFSGAALLSLFLAANSARAELESSEHAAGLGEQVADAACAASGDAAQSPICQDGRLIWRLCEKGFRSERLPNAGVYACFLHSL
jgi:hypothetical protein